MPPKTTRRHKQGAESRERVLDAALEIAAERGYDGTTMALVTERSSIPPSSVYWHFKNKDALMAAVLEHSYTRWHSAEKEFETVDRGDARTRIRHRFDRVRVGLTERPEFWRLGLMLALLSGPDGIAARERFLQIRQETLDATVDWVERVLGADAIARQPKMPELLTQFLMAAGDGLFMASIVDTRWNITKIVNALGRATAEVAVRMAAEPKARRTPKSPFPARPDQRPAPEDSRERLLWAASIVAAEHGYVGTTISRICNVSGLPVSSVYWYFTDKDALLAAVVQASWDDWLSNQPQWDPAHGLKQRSTVLHRILLEGTRSFVNTPDFLRVGLSVGLARREEEAPAQKLFVSMRTMSEHRVAEWFIASFDGPPQPGDKALGLMLARIVVAVTDGLFVAEQIDSWDWDLDALITVFVAVINEIIAERDAH